MDPWLIAILASTTILTGLTNRTIWLLGLHLALRDTRAAHRPAILNAYTHCQPTNRPAQHPRRRRFR